MYEKIFMSTKKLEFKYIHQNQIYVAEVDKHLIMAVRKINEFITDIINLETMHRITGADRQGDLMMINDDKIITMMEY